MQQAPIHTLISHVLQQAINGTRGVAHLTLCLDPFLEPPRKLTSTHSLNVCPVKNCSGHFTVVRTGLLIQAACVSRSPPGSVQAKV